MTPPATVTRSPVSFIAHGGAVHFEQGRRVS